MDTRVDISDAVDAAARADAECRQRRRRCCLSGRSSHWAVAGICQMAAAAACLMVPLSLSLKVANADVTETKNVAACCLICHRCIKASVAEVAAAELPSTRMALRCCRGITNGTAAEIVQWLRRRCTVE